MVDTYKTQLDKLIDMCSNDSMVELTMELSRSGLKNKNEILSHGVKTNNTTVVKVALDSGADVDYVIYSDILSGESPVINLACHNGNLKIVKLLVYYGANIDTSSPDSYSALHEAASNNKLEIVNYLLDVDPDIIDTHGRHQYTALLIACENGHIEVVRCLLNRGANVNIGDPLMTACIEGYTEIVKLLLEKKPYINDRAFLHIACKNGNLPLVSILVNIESHIDSMNSDGKTPLYYACINGFDDIIHVLLANGANPKLVQSPDALTLYCNSKYPEYNINDVTIRKLSIAYIETTTYGPNPI